MRNAIAVQMKLAKQPVLSTKKQSELLAEIIANVKANYVKVAYVLEIVMVSNVMKQNAKLAGQMDVWSAPPV